MTKEQRLQIENELMREFRLLYNPANISDEQLKQDIETQESVVEMFGNVYNSKQTEEAAEALFTEVMKLEIWKDIYLSRQPVKVEGSDLDNFDIKLES